MILLYREAFYYAGINYRSAAYEINTKPDFSFSKDKQLTMEEINQTINDAMLNKVDFGATVNSTQKYARLLSEQTTYFWNKDANEVSGKGNIAIHGLPHHTETAVMDENTFTDTYKGKIEPQLLESNGYTKKGTYYYNTGTVLYHRNKDSFYSIKRAEDQFGNNTYIEYDPYHMFITKTTDSKQNENRVETDYRTCSPYKQIDPNHIETDIKTDELGMVIASSIYQKNSSFNPAIKFQTNGNETESGDKPASQYNTALTENYTLSDVVTNKEDFVQDATAAFFYDLTFDKNDPKPLKAVSVKREEHFYDMQPEETKKVQISIAYTDGFGRDIQSKMKVEDGNITTGEATAYSTNRWLVSGRTIYNNKQKPVKQYEPFYSDTYTFEDEDSLTHGVTPVIYYDPAGRVIKTETPKREIANEKKGFKETTEYTPWTIKHHDYNDNILNSDYFSNNTYSGPETIEGSISKNSILSTQIFSNTPKEEILDTLGRVTETKDRIKTDTLDLEATVKTKYNITGKPVRITDAGGKTSFKYKYDMAGNPLLTESCDSGKKFTLLNAAGNPVITIDAKDQKLIYEYDTLNRPVKIFKNSKNGTLLEKYVYGEDRFEPDQNNTKGKLTNIYDQSGMKRTLFYDIDGNPVTESNYIRKTYKNETDWKNENDINNVEPVTSSFSHDALGRIKAEIRNENSITEYTYHESGRLNTVKRREWTDTQFTPQVNSIEYNARGQRNKITYGNDTHTTYEYDKYDFRLINQKTVKTSDTSVVLQENIYKYDPVGNIYSIEDKSRDTVFYSNLAVNPVKTYKYDSLYRVIEVNGWQHSGSMPNLKGDTDLQTGIPSTSDRIAVTTYTETFKYDVNGNVLDKKLVAGANTNIVTYTYQTATNRLASMTEGASNGSLTYNYTYDANGNITDMGNGTTLSWGL